MVSYIPDFVLHFPSRSDNIDVIHASQFGSPERNFAVRSCAHPTHALRPYPAKR